MLYQNDFYYLGLIVLMPLIGAIINGVFGAKLPKKLVGFIACGSILTSFFFTLVSIMALVANGQGEGAKKVYGHLSYTAYQWIYAGDFGVDVAFLLDPLTALLLLLITGVGFLIHIYSVGYMEHDKSMWRYFSYLNLFCFAMLLLVLGKNMLVTFIGWEGVGLCSYLLIGFWYDDDAKAAAGQKAFIVNRVGDFAFLVGMFILYYEMGTLDYMQMAEFGTSQAGLAKIAPVAGIAVSLIFIGCTGKSAQIPLYVWLPDAMAGPTPVSALIHAATMVTAGVFLLARLNWLFTINPQAMMVVAWVGALTAFFAATIAIVQNDIKKVLAYSTVSQLGYMFLAVGVGSFTAAVFHLMTHAFFKALLFLGSGSVIHAMSDEQDIRKMGGLRKHMPFTAATFLMGCLAIAGFPLFSGFFSKDLILWSALSNTHIFQIEAIASQPNFVRFLVEQAPALASGTAHDVMLAGKITAYGTFILGLITAFMTAFYMFRLYFLTFEGECRADEETKSHLHESPPSMVIPLVILGVLAVIGGLTGWPHFIAHVFEESSPSVAHFMLYFEHWFDEVFLISNEFRIANHFGAHPEKYEMAVTALGSLAGLSGIGLAWYMYMKNTELPGKIQAGLAALHEVLENKYYVDEGYDRAFVQGSIFGGKGLTFFDKQILDGGLVNGAGAVMKSAGRILRHLQSGNVQRYATYITLGVVLAMIAVMVMYA